MVKRKVMLLMTTLMCWLLMSGSVFAEAFSDLANSLHQYHKGQDVFFMYMLVAFLMLFIKRFQWGITLVTVLTLAVSFPLYLFVQQAVFGFDMIASDMIILGIVCSITLIIACGMFLGTIKTWVFLIAAVLFVPAYSLHEWWLFTYLEGVADAGGSILVHVFACYWGYGVILSIRNKEIFDAPMNATTDSVDFVWLASMILMVLWPSFTGALVAPDMVLHVMVITYFALFGSCLSVYVMLSMLQKRIDPLVFCYACLAGGVTIGSLVDLVGPGTALIVGAVAGILSCFMFLYVAPVMNKALGVFDVMGVHNLHGGPGILGALIAIQFAGMVNLTAVVGSMAIALVTGLITGVILKSFGKPTHNLDDLESMLIEDARAAESANA